MRHTCTLLAAAAFSAHILTPATAAPAVGCDGFLWPLKTEIALLTSPDSETVATGATVPAASPDKAITLALKPAPEVTLPIKGTGTPKPGDDKKFAGFVSFTHVPAGHYQISLSRHGWIDVVQNGAALEATGHTGSANCDTLGKSVRFEISDGPLAIQVNGVKQDTIKITVRPAAD